MRRIVLLLGVALASACEPAPTTTPDDGTDKLERIDVTESPSTADAPADAKAAGPVDKKAVPKVLKEHSEGWFAYKDIVDNAAAAAEQKAIGLYEETIKRSKEYSIANEWTSSARERLNIYKPEEYPLLRQPALELQLEDAR